MTVFLSLASAALPVVAAYLFCALSRREFIDPFIFGATLLLLTSVLVGMGVNPKPLQTAWLAICAGLLISTMYLRGSLKNLTSCSWRQKGFRLSSVVDLNILWLVPLLFIGFGVESWDGLSYWFLKSLPISELAASRNVVIPPTKHPPLVTGFLTWVSACVMNPSEARPVACLLQVLLVYYTIKVIVKTFPSPYCPLFGFIGIYFVLSSPLFFNHLISVGYAEIFLAITLLLSWSLVAASCSTDNQNRIKISVMLVLVLSLMCFTKNLGFFYAVAIAFAYFLAFKRRVGLSILLTGIITTAVLIAFPAGIYTIFGSLERGITIITGSAPEVGFYTMWVKLKVHAVDSVFENMTHAYFLNQSFSTLFFLFFICVCSFFRDRPGSMQEIRLPCFLLLVPVLVIFQQNILQAFTDYGFQYARVSSDTGYSRSHIAITPWIALSAMYFVGFVYRGSRG